MLAALIHGKLGRLSPESEDLVTSTVFGGLRYLRPIEALLPFLAEARCVDGSSPLAWLRGLESSVEVEYDFWPMWRGEGVLPCEPDIVLDIRSTRGGGALVLVEAKLRSGKSSQADASAVAPYDQLAREWSNLVQVAGTRGAAPFLVYLTADFAMPAADIEASILDWERKPPPGAPEPVFAWLSWRHLHSALADRDDAVSRDIVELLDRLSLRPFGGIGLAEDLPAWPPWRFRRAWRWESALPRTPMTWRFPP